AQLHSPDDPEERTMSASILDRGLEHLNPHDLVTYSRCPHEMELTRARRASVHSGLPTSVCTPPDVVPIRHSPLFLPPTGHLVVNEGPVDVFAGDRLIYSDENEEGIPVLFPPDQVLPEPQLRRHGANL